MEGTSFFDADGGGGGGVGEVAGRQFSEG